MEELLKLLQDRAAELAGKHRDLAQSYISERIIRQRTYEAGIWNSVAEANRAMDLAAVGFANDISRLRGDIDALTVEWETLRTIIARSNGD